MNLKNLYLKYEFEDFIFKKLKMKICLMNKKLYFASLMKQIANQIFLYMILLKLAFLIVNIAQNYIYVYRSV